MQNLNNLIKFHRKKCGLSQKELADLAGVGKTVVFDIEKGKTSIQWATLQKILTVLNIKIKFESPLLSNSKDEV
jgi:HTH-type transcriptional regulator / antitoxin HipB